MLSLISLGFIVPYEGDEVPAEEMWYQVQMGEHFSSRNPKEPQ